MNFSGLTVTLKFFSFLIASWFFVHLIAVLGIFSAVIYPFWCFLMPKKTMCFVCRIKRDGEYCFFCRQKVKKSDGDYPKSISSLILNSLVIFLFSSISLGLVFVENKVLFAFGFPSSPKTVSFSIPQKGQYRLGEIFPMKIEIAGVKTPVNTIQTDIGFNPERLEVVEISTKNSFANIFIQKEINNKAGYARLTGGLPNPGFSSDRGIFGTIFFKGKSPGAVKIEFLPTSMVLANDGHGTNVLKDFKSVSYLILPDKLMLEDEEAQKQVIIEPGVLGEKVSEETQMIFYEDNSILGTQSAGEENTSKKISGKKEIDFTGLFLRTIEKIDGIILVFWENIFSR